MQEILIFNLKTAQFKNIEVFMILNSVKFRTKEETAQRLKKTKTNMSV
mgnify:CR=1 FL=1